MILTINDFGLNSHSILNIKSQTVLNPINTNINSIILCLIKRIINPLLAQAFACAYSVLAHLRGLNS